MAALTAGMGVLIVAGVAVIAVTLLHRARAGAAALPDVVLEEPAGTRITGIAPAGDRLAVLLTGGGQDRVLLLDLRAGAAPARITLHTP